MRDIAKDLRWGVGWGLFAGIIYVVFAAAVILLKGGIPDSAPEHVTPLTLLSLYPIFGISAGLIVGLLRSFLETRRGAMLVGILAAFPVGVGFLWFTEGPISTWGGAGWFAAAGGAILLGGMGGYIWWGQLHDFDPEAFLKKNDAEEIKASRKRKSRKPAP